MSDRGYRDEREALAAQLAAMSERLAVLERENAELRASTRRAIEREAGLRLNTSTRDMVLVLGAIVVLVLGSVFISALLHC